MDRLEAMSVLLAAVDAGSLSAAARQRAGSNHIAHDLPLHCPGGKSAALPTVGAALPPAARGPVHSDCALVLPQHPRLVARERFAGAVIFVPAANKQFDGTLQA